jgi:MinD-like ATPase involved in chromosome partitioning or flagellar assembly
MEKIMKYDELIDGLIKTNIKNRNRMKEFVESVSALIWAFSFCTILCDIGRGVGKTTYIKSHATLNDLIIVCNKNIARIYQKYGFTQNTYTIVDFLDGKSRGQIFENIYVDDANIVFEKTEDKIRFYQQCTTDGKEHTFILLG